MFRENDNLTAKELDALLEASNERLRLETEHILRSNEAKAEQTETIRKQNAILRDVLERQRRLAERIRALLAEAREEERASKSDIKRALAMR